MKINVDGRIEDLELVYGVADNRPQDWTLETVQAVSDGITDDEGNPIVREKHFEILKKIEEELKKNNQFSFYVPVFYSLPELYIQMVNENKERAKLASNKMARIVKIAIKKKADEESKKIKSIHIDSAKATFMEGKQGRMEMNKEYPYEEFQKLINKFDYKVYNDGDYLGGYDKTDVTANITITYEDGTQTKDQYNCRIDLGDGRITYDAINLKYFIEQEYNAKVDNPTVPYNTEEYAKEFGVWDTNADEYLAKQDFKLPEYPDYSKKTIDEIGVGDIFKGDGYEFYKVTKRTPSSIYVERVKAKRVSKQIKNTKDKMIDYETYVVISDDGELWGTGMIDTSKPLRLRTFSNSGDRVYAIQGRNSIHAWSGQFLPESRYGY